MRDSRHSKLGDDDQSQRYAIIGLTRGYTKEDLDWAVIEKKSEEVLYRAGMPRDSSDSDKQDKVAAFAQHL